MILKETIHHGNYRNSRERRIHPVTRADVLEWLSECPYTVSAPERVADELMSATPGWKSVDRGWVHWEAL